MQIWVEVGWNLSGAIEVAVDVGSSRSRSSDGVVKVVVVVVAVVVEVGWNLSGAIEVVVDVCHLINSIWKVTCMSGGRKSKKRFPTGCNTPNEPA